jgi:hypothetical protein
LLFCCSYRDASINWDVCEYDRGPSLHRYVQEIEFGDENDEEEEGKDGIAEEQWRRVLRPKRLLGFTNKDGVNNNFLEIQEEKNLTEVQQQATFDAMMARIIATLTAFSRRLSEH